MYRIEVIVIYLKLEWSVHGCAGMTLEYVNANGSEGLCQQPINYNFVPSSPYILIIWGTLLIYKPYTCWAWTWQVYILITFNSVQGITWTY